MALEGEEENAGQGVNVQQEEQGAIGRCQSIIMHMYNG
jgi:hypothetical protein